MKGRPPKFPFKILKWFCRPDYHLDIEGDLLELYEHRLENMSRKKAYWKLVKDIILLFRPSILKILSSPKKLNYMGLMKQNIRFTFRHFNRHRKSFFINLIGLSTGLACASLIYLWVLDELNVDKFHTNDHRLYQIMKNGVDGGSINTSPHTPTPLAKALIDEIPEVETAVSVIGAKLCSEYLGDFKLSTDSTLKISSLGQFAQKDFFKVFSYNLIHGDSSSVLTAPKSIAISEGLALRLFKYTDHAVGQLIHWQLSGFSGDAKVTGIYEDIPNQSTEQFDFVLGFDSWHSLASQMGISSESWDNNAPSTYVLLHQSNTLEAFNKDIKTFIQPKNPGTKSELMAIPYSSQYLYGNFDNGHQTPSRANYVRLFFAIAIFIVVIACINFMNLSTAKASLRVKEIGVKKALGISRKDLMIQFLTESLILTLLSSLVALVLVLIALPYFNYISGKELAPDFSLNFIATAIGVILGTGLIAGSYPALYLSSFDPIVVLKGLYHQSLGESRVRKALVVFQFAASIILISGIMVIYKQINFIQNKDLGYDRQQVVFFPREGEIVKKESAFLTELRNIPGVINASSMGGNLIGGLSTTGGLKWKGKDPDLTIDFAQIPVNIDLIETLGINILEGRSFSKDYNETRNIIFNEAAISIMGMDHPIGTNVRLWGDDYNIIGIAKDFHLESFQKNVIPVFLFVEPSQTFTIMTRIQSGQELKTIHAIEDVYHNFNPSYPFSFTFLDQHYQSSFKSEQYVSKLSRYFACLAIMISCLGLLGLVEFTIERRTKEIAIRKILGLSEIGIIRLISNHFIKLVLSAILIALPVSYFLSKHWLDQYVYRVTLDDYK